MSLNDILKQHQAKEAAEAAASKKLQDDRSAKAAAFYEKAEAKIEEVLAWWQTAMEDVKTEFNFNVTRQKTQHNGVSRTTTAVFIISKKTSGAREHLLQLTAEAESEEIFFYPPKLNQIQDRSPFSLEQLTHGRAKAILETSFKKVLEHGR